MKIISFELTMPGVNSWNGKWTGERNKYYIVQNMDNKSANALMKSMDNDEILERKSWGYNFGDGWRARVTAEVIDSKEAKKRIKISAGFYGYEWMIYSIKLHDKIID